MTLAVVQIRCDQQELGQAQKRGATVYGTDTQTRRHTDTQTHIVNTGLTWTCSMNFCDESNNNET